MPQIFPKKLSTFSAGKFSQGKDISKFEEYTPLVKNFSSIIYFHTWSKLYNTTDFNSALADQFEAKKWHYPVSVHPHGNSNKMFLSCIETKS